MLINKRFSAAAVAAVLALTAACSSSGSSTPPAGTDTGGSGAPTPTATSTGYKTSSIVYASGGGANTTAVDKACVQPFAAAHGLTAQDADTGGSTAKLQSILDSGSSVPWNIMTGVQMPGANDWSNLLTPIDYSIVDKTLAPSQFYTKFGVGFYQYPLVIAWNTTKFPNGGPQSLADFFNTTKFPGKRAFPSVQVDGPALISEIASVGATGVWPPAYPLDQQKAMDFMSKQKDLTVYTSSGNAEQLFTNGQVDLGIIYASRVNNLQKAGVPVDFTWNQNINSFQSLEVPKNSPDPAMSMDFINFCLSKEAQVTYANNIANAPVNPDAVAALPADVTKFLVSVPEHAAAGFTISSTYWNTTVTDSFSKAWQQWELG